MKRVGFLFEHIITLENLYIAFHKSARGRTGKKEVFEFQKNLSFNLLKIQKELLNNRFIFGNYHYFTIYDPKIRKICASSFPERVISHAIMNVCHDSFEKKQVYSSCACRKNKGTFFALNLAVKGCKSYKYFLKLDVRKYFDSIDHKILELKLLKLFKDEKVISLFRSIISTYHTEIGKGLPIGNLTSQYFANHYLCEADHYLKESLKTPFYIRYMDDMVLFSNNKKELLDIGFKFKDYLFSNLRLEIKPFCLNYTSKGLPFLGYLFYNNKVKLTKSSRKRFIDKIKNYQKNLDKGIWNQEDYKNHIIPLISYTEFAKAKGFRKKILSELDNNRGAFLSV
ncbi:MAG: reverse transcriptase [Candidatus Cloacimonadota bacterium]|nr:MAG: reverse transcriptase [Candidatus Cloacimonadota bacterium]PIE79755.1 MAG: reverse transcriptase [Candidatus Delongbacteria bacterium]